MISHASRPLFAAALALTLAASACSVGNKPGSKHAAKAPHSVAAPTKKVTISFASWVGDEPAMKKLYAGFHKKYPNITVSFNNIPADSEGQKLVTMVAGGTAPDVAYVDGGSVQDFASRGALAGLDGYVKASKVVKKSNYVAAFAGSSSYQGEMYGLPFDAETTGLFYRTDYFKQAGIAHPPATWDEMLADAKKLNDPAKKRYAIAMFGPEAGYYVQPFIASAGGHLLSADGKKVLLDQPAAVRATKFYTGLAKYAPPDYLTSNSYDGRVAFEHGQVAMYIAGSWFGGSVINEAPKLAGKWATAPLPKDKTCSTKIAGDSLVMFDQSTHKDAAWLWMQYLSSPDSLRTWNVGQPDSTELPPLTSLLDDSSTFKGKAWLKSFASMMSCDSTEQQGAHWPEIEQRFDDDLTKVLYGKLSVEKALADTAAYARKQIGQ